MANTHILISSTTVGSDGAANISFTSIPNTYTDLLLYVSVRTTQANNSRTLYLRFNSSSTSYSQRSIYGNGSSTLASQGADYGTSWIYCGECNGSTSTSNTFSNTLIYIPNYAGSLNKTVMVDSTQEDNQQSALSTFMVGLWSNTAAITTVLLAPDAGNFAQYSTAYLYGIKNS